MKRLVIAGGNSVYGFRGTLYQKFVDNSTELRVHEVEDKDAEFLLNDHETPWREADEDGKPVPNEADQMAAEKADESASARTINVDNSTPATGKTAKQDADAAEKAAEATAKPKKTLNISSKTKAAPETKPAEGDGTDGAVTV